MPRTLTNESWSCINTHVHTHLVETSQTAIELLYAAAARMRDKPTRLRASSIANALALACNISGSISRAITYLNLHLLHAPPICKCYIFQGVQLRVRWLSAAPRWCERGDAHSATWHLNYETKSTTSNMRLEPLKCAIRFVWVCVCGAVVCVYVCVHVVDNLCWAGRQFMQSSLYIHILLIGKCARRLEGFFSLPSDRIGVVKKKE